MRLNRDPCKKTQKDPKRPEATYDSTAATPEANYAANSKEIPEGHNHNTKPPSRQSHQRPVLISWRILELCASCRLQIAEPEKKKTRKIKIKKEEGVRDGDRDKERAQLALG